jgi:hypothetical protein
LQVRVKRLHPTSVKEKGLESATKALFFFKLEGPKEKQKENEKKD